MNRSLSILAAVFAFSSLAGCASAPDESQDDADVSASGEEALSSNPNANYFIATRPDFRKCSSPMCGGVYVKQVNKARTVCADGRLAAECYVGTFAAPGSGFSAAEQGDLVNKFKAGQLVIRATLGRHNGSTVIGKLTVSEAWEAASGAVADGTFYRLADNGIRCIQAPCPSTTAYTLNSTDTFNVTAASLEHTNPPADQDEIDRGTTAIGTKQGTLISGGIAIPRCIAGTRCGPVAVVSEFYLRVTPKPVARSCGGRAGNTCRANEYCAFDLNDTCGWADAQATCQPRPQMCIQLYKPVCGCDGKTYSNSCHAAAAGTAVVSDGACVTPR